MGGTKERPANVPAENEYHNVHWLVLVTYAAAIAGVTILIVNAGLPPRNCGHFGALTAAYLAC